MAPTAPPERRPAVWPWVVMPLVALAIFFALFELDKARHAIDPVDPDTAARSTADSTTP